VPKINKKNEKEWRNLEKWGFGKNGGNAGNWGDWWLVVGGNGRWWCGGWLGSDGWRWCMVGLDFRECLKVENGEAEGEVYGRYRRMRQMGEN
jgi:hypothetical protein